MGSWTRLVILASWGLFHPVTPEITVRKTVRTAISISIGIFAMSSNDAEARIEIITGRRRDRHSHVDLGMGAEDVRRHQKFDWTHDHLDYH